MIFIAHRGNTSGPNTAYENTVDYMNEALDQGYHVECDIQLYNGALWFGHDGPHTPVNTEFLNNRNIIAHAKSVDALAVLIKMGVHCFFHDRDDCTFTNRGYVWCYPGVYAPTEKAIWLDIHGYGQKLPENIPGIYGICGDNASVLDRIKK